MNYINDLYIGRLNRRNFFFGFLTLFILVIVLITAVSVGLVSIFNITDASLTKLPNIIIFTLIVIILFMAFNYLFGLYTRRLHDMGRSGWWAVVWFFPYLNLLFIIYLVFAKGNERENAYGLPQTANKNPIKVILNRD